MTKICSCQAGGGRYAETVPTLLERPRYATGLILEESDLAASVDYTRSLSRLLFRNLFGCGVICGLTVQVEETCGLKVNVAPGLALDGCGDPVQLPRSVAIEIDRREAGKLKQSGKPFWIVLCGKERMCRPRSPVCEADDDEGVAQPTRIQALAEVSISFENPASACGCPTRGEPEAEGVAFNGKPLPERESCQDEHEAREDCAKDCGCGTACDCGCCVLLAKCWWHEDEWSVRHKGVRRLIRTKLIDDREPGSEPAPPPPAAGEPTDLYWGLADGNINAAVLDLYEDMMPGDRFTRAQVLELLRWNDIHHAGWNGGRPHRGTLPPVTGQ